MKENTVVDGLLFEKGKCYQAFCGMCGSKLCRMWGKLALVISYDDILDEEIEAFRDGRFSMKIKTFGSAAILMFCFDGRLVDASFDFVEDYLQMEVGCIEKSRKESLTIIVCESSIGEVCEWREVIFSEEVDTEWKRLREGLYEMYGTCYDPQEIKGVLTGIYDNHTIDEINELVGDKELVFELH